MTEKCTSGMLNAATMPSTAAYRAPRSRSSIIPRSSRYPRYMTKRIETLVSRASHVHQMPQVGFPQIEPVAIVMPVKTTPTSAEACASRSAASARFARYAIDATKTTAKARYATHTLGTCRYMMRCTLPCVASRGASPSPATSPAASATTVTTPRTRIIRLALQHEVERQHADGDVHDVRGHEQLEPVGDRPERFTQQHCLGRLDGGQQDRHLHREQQDGEQQLPGADLTGHGREEGADGREAERSQPDDDRQRRQRGDEIEIEEHAEESQEHRLDDEHQQQVAGELADVDR